MKILIPALSVKVNKQLITGSMYVDGSTRVKQKNVFSNAVMRVSRKQTDISVDGTKP